MPPHVRDRWQTSFGIPWVNDGTLDAAYARIAAEFNIGPISDRSPAPNPSGVFLKSGAAKLGLPDDAIRDNLVNMGNAAAHDPRCLGCGYCNLVCGYLRKNSVLQVSLPAAVKSVQSNVGRLTIFLGRKALEIAGERTNGAFHATGVRVAHRVSSEKEEVILGRNVIVAAGAVGSSAVLLGSPGIRALSLPIGEKFSMNIGSPVHAEYAAPVKAFEATQMAHHYRPRAAEGFIVETWYNTPAQQSLALPGWLDELDANIRKYSNYACAAPLVGTTSKSFISRTSPSSEEEINIRLQDSDLDKLKEGLKTVCRFFLNSTPKPSRVLIASRRDWLVTESNFERRISDISSFDDIQIATAHPQGGNRMSSKPGMSQGDGVVDVKFKLYGSDNVFVCDASVFPASLGVNPHWTIMAAADIAASQF
jgi:choline dehydrogenase-like flavoprotein